MISAGRTSGQQDAPQQRPGEPIGPPSAHPTRSGSGSSEHAGSLAEQAEEERRTRAIRTSTGDQPSRRGSAKSPLISRHRIQSTSSAPNRRPSGRRASHGTGRRARRLA